MDHFDNIKQNISANITEMYGGLITTFRDSPELKGKFIGEVIDNNDPDKLGRCKIIVFGAFSENTSPKNLPWALPEFSFIGSTKGSFIVPAIGAYVNVYFADDEIAFPVYTTKALNIHQLPTNIDKNYPHNMVFFETDNGDSLEIDRETSETVFTHSTGTRITISSDGSIDVFSAKDITTNHTDTLTMMGNVVDPIGIGPFNAINVCPFSGALHSGIQCSSMSTFDPEDEDLDREIIEAVIDTGVL